MQHPIRVTFSGVRHLPDPQGGPVNDALSVAIAACVVITKRLPDSPVRDRLEQAIGTLDLIREGTMPELERGIQSLPDILDMILFGRVPR